MTIDISFIIVSWNAKAFLLSCLESIVRTVHDCAYEIIVVDNASDDGSPDAVEAAFPQVRVLRLEENLGFAAGNNRGIANSRGRWLCLVNSDVELLPGCVDGLLRVMEGGADIGLIAPRILNADRTLQRSCRRFPSLWHSFCSALGLSTIVPNSEFFGGTFMRWWPHDTQRDVDVVSGCFWFVRSEAMTRIGGLDEEFFMYGEDIDWCRRLHAQGWRIEFTPESEAIHHGGGSSRNQPLRFFMAQQEADLRYWSKHHGPFATSIRAGIMLLHQCVRIVAHCAIYPLRHHSRDEQHFKIARSVACTRWLIGGGWRQHAIAAPRPLYREERAGHV